MSEESPRKRANYVPAPHYFNLNQACRLVNDALGDFGCYLVGSSIHRRDYRDVDVRFIMPDERFAELFGDVNVAYMHPLWALVCSSVSLWLSTQSGLPVDFQIQQQTAATSEFSSKSGHKRLPLGVFLSPEAPAYAATISAEREKGGPES